MPSTQLPSAQIKDNDIKNVDIAANAAIAFSKLAGVAASSHVHATADITTGQFLDARIKQSNVTQYVSAIDHDALSNFVTQEHIRWDLTGTGTIHSTNYTDTVYSHPNHSGDVTSVGDGAQTIVADAVTYAKMQNVAADDRILGNIGGAGGVITELTATQVRTMIDTLYTADGFLIDRTTTTPDTVGDSAGITLNYLGSGATPKPAGTDFSMITMAYSAAWQNQIAADWREGGRLFIRGQENTIWTNWKQVWSEIDFANNSGNWNTAYGWGDHGAVGYISGYTVTESDVTGHEAAINHDALSGFVLEEHLRWDLSQGAMAFIHTDNYTEGGAGTDTTAIHDNVAGEINAITEKTAQVGADMLLIEDSLAANVKKKLKLDNLLNANANTWPTEFGASKTTIADIDILIFENNDGAAGGKASISFDNFESTLSHDALAQFVADEHINWKNSQGGMNIIHNDNINGTDALFSILDGNRTLNHDFVFTNGVLTSYGTSAS